MMVLNQLPFKHVFNECADVFPFEKTALRRCGNALQYYTKTRLRSVLATGFMFFFRPTALQ